MNSDHIYSFIFWSWSLLLLWVCIKAYDGCTITSPNLEIESKYFSRTMILVYSAVLSAYVYKYVSLHIRRCLRCDYCDARGSIYPKIRCGARSITPATLHHAITTCHIAVIFLMLTGHSLCNKLVNSLWIDSLSSKKSAKAKSFKPNGHLAMKCAYIYSDIAISLHLDSVNG